MQFVRDPRAAVRIAGASPNVAGALVVTATVSAILGVTSFGAAMIGDGVERPGFDGLAIAIVGATVSGLAGISLAVIGAASLHLSAHAVGGAGRFRSMFTVVGYSIVVGVFVLPAIVVGDILPVASAWLARDAAILFAVSWWTVLAALGVRALYETPWRAVPGALILALIGGASTVLVLLAVLSLVGIFAVSVVVP